MKNKIKILSLALSMILLIGSSSIAGVDAKSTPYITSDTTTNVILAVPDGYDLGIGAYPVEYTVKFTVHGSDKAPVVKVGNSKMVTAKLIKKNGSDYFYKIKVVNDVKFTGTSGHSFIFKTKKDAENAGKRANVPIGSTGVYIALPGQQYTRPFVVSVENFEQLYPQPKYGTILYDHQISQNTYWLWARLDYEQFYKDGKWQAGFSYGGWGGINDKNAAQYEADLEKEFPGLDDTPLPTSAPKSADDNTIIIHTLWVYLGGGSVSTSNW